MTMIRNVLLKNCDLVNRQEHKEQHHRTFIIMKIGCISDTHQEHRKLVPAETLHGLDCLIVAGDFTYRGQGCEDFVAWIEDTVLQHVKYVVIVCGNHEMPMGDFMSMHISADISSKLKQFTSRFPRRVFWLHEDRVTLEGITFYGVVWHMKQSSMGEGVPDTMNDIDVLVTHRPPKGIRDRRGIMGCPTLRAFLDKHIAESERWRFHVFGHVHDWFGLESWQRQGPLQSRPFTVVNAARQSAVRNPGPIVFKCEPCAQNR
jgi:Icc-related predicted phosphoesterase